jgi:hypothetical protein
MKCDKRIGAELLLQSWDELSESAVTAGWDFGEPAEEDEESESGSSNDEFELEVNPDVSDEDLSEITDAAEEDEADCKNQQLNEFCASKRIALANTQAEARKV